MIPDFELSCAEFNSVGLTLSREQYDKLRIYSKFLVEYNEKVNLTAIKEPMEILRKHFIDSISIEKILKENNIPYQKEYIFQLKKTKDQYFQQF